VPTYFATVLAPEPEIESGVKVANTVDGDPGTGDPVLGLSERITYLLEEKLVWSPFPIRTLIVLIDPELRAINF
jgi:hypothetical protein